MPSKTTPRSTGRCPQYCNILLHNTFSMPRNLSIRIINLVSHSFSVPLALPLACRRKPTFLTMLLVTFAITLTFVSTAVEAKDPSHLQFDYDPFSPNGPPLWNEVNVTGNEWEKFVGKGLTDLDIDGNECGSPRRPSPLNLVATAKCHDNHEMLTRQIRSTDCKFDSLTFSITPHTLRATFPLNDNTCIRPTIDLPNGYPYRWHAHFIEIHLRAEHLLDGRRYDGELQINHLGQKDQKRKVSTVSVMLDASHTQDDPKLQQYIDQWQAISDEVKSKCEGRQLIEKKGEETSAAKSSRYLNIVQQEKELSSDDMKSEALARRAIEDVEHRDGGHRALEEEDVEEVRGPRRKMFPYDIWPTIYFYRYQGQLTSPPCSEIVVWRILDEPLRISRKQLKQLAKLIAGYTDEETCSNTSAASAEGENYRPIEEINPEKQELTHCTAKDFTFWMYPPDQQ